MTRTKMTTEEARNVLANTPREDLLALLDDRSRAVRRWRRAACLQAVLLGTALAVDIATRAIVFAVVPL